MGIIGLVLGLSAIVLAIVPVVTVVAWIPAIVGIILSAIGMSKAKKEGKSSGFAIAGLVISIIALPFWPLGCCVLSPCVAVTCGAGAAVGAFGGGGW